MASYTAVLILLATLSVVSTVAQSLASSLIRLPVAYLGKSSQSPSSVVSPSVSPSVSVKNAPSPSPSAVNSPPSPPR
ncbi:hypothetical protein RYX36_005045 [Vicia faba]